MTVWIYVDTRYRVGHPSRRLRARRRPKDWFKENDAEGVAFEYEVIGR
jgi:hypothetical protein